MSTLEDGDRGFAAVTTILILLGGFAGVETPASLRIDASAGAKAHIAVARIMFGLKPVPFTPSSSSASGEVVP